MDHKPGDPSGAFWLWRHWMRLGWSQKLPAVSVSIILAVSLSACVPFEFQPPGTSSPVPAFTSPRVTPALPQTTASPIPAQLATATRTSEASFYESAPFGFRVPIPAQHRAAELPLQNGILLAVGFAPSGSTPTERFESPIGLTIYEKSPDVSLLDWFSMHIGSLTESGQPSSDQAFFYDPIIHNHHDFNGLPALQYEADARPVPYETVIYRGAWVIGLYYLRDYSQDYQQIYEHMLASLELLTPTAQPDADPTQAPPSPTPTVCLDASAEPRVLPSRETPLEVHFISDGNVWAWEEITGMAQQVSDTRDARSFRFSPDGQVVAFTRGPVYGQAELWGIRRNGTDLRRLISAKQLQSLVGEPSTTEHAYWDNIAYLDWIGGTHRLGFEVRRNYDAIGGCCESGGYWQMDVDTGQLSPWTPPESVTAPEGVPSPDGRQVAIIQDTSVSLMNADGSNLREDVFTFTTAIAHEGGGTIYPHIEWANDSQALLAITFEGDPHADDAPLTIWRIPVDGSPVQALRKFSNLLFWVHLSPDHAYLAYKQRVRPMSNEYALRLATLDGSADSLYLAQHGLEFLHWHPDSYHFVYTQWTIYRPFLGSVYGGAVPLLDAADTPATQIQWVDANRFLFAKGSLDPTAGPRELRLGQIGGASILIGPFNGDGAQYAFNVEDAAVGKD